MSQRLKSASDPRQVKEEWRCKRRTHTHTHRNSDTHPRIGNTSAKCVSACAQGVEGLKGGPNAIEPKGGEYKVQERSTGIYILRGVITTARNQTQATERKERQQCGSEKPATAKKKGRRAQ